MNSIISVEGLTKHFQSFTLGPLEFKQEQGTVVALVGPNGSGKSTFFHSSYRDYISHFIYGVGRRIFGFYEVSI